jgi:hypothetical protein
VIRSLLFNIAKRIATDPKVKQKAALTYEQEIKPVVRDVTERAKRNMEFAAGKIQETAKESHPLKEPGNFIKKVRRKLFDPEDSD